ncbi:MAG: hypothetical protein ACON4R_03190 [Akkermansiaceae bacterium]
MCSLQPRLTAYQNHVSVRIKQHRLIRYEDGSLEFYDLTKDPSGFAGKSESSEIREGLTKLLPKLQLLDRIDRSTRKNRKEKK